jgi:hypothetical protein
MSIFVGGAALDVAEMPPRDVGPCPPVARARRRRDPPGPRGSDLQDPIEAPWNNPSRIFRFLQSFVGVFLFF